MSKEDREGFIVKFVESKGQKTEYSVKAYEVYPELVCTDWQFAQIILCLSSLHRPFWSYSLKNT